LDFDHWTPADLNQLEWDIATELSDVLLVVCAAEQAFCI
jgi:hypothetical protein